jgi:hypothetical protein
MFINQIKFAASDVGQQINDDRFKLNFVTELVNFVS